MNPFILTAIIVFIVFAAIGTVVLLVAFLGSEGIGLLGVFATVAAFFILLAKSFPRVKK